MSKKKVKKTVTKTDWIDEDDNYVTEVVTETESCGPICKTVKVAATIGGAALLIGALASKK